VAVIEITVSFVLGKSVKVVAKNKKLQKVLDAFWNDEDNHMDSRVYDLCQELAIYGEHYRLYPTQPPFSTRACPS